ncbi:MAG: TIGR03084 family metal-binding protein [Ilumatobacteraceae bacterium]
MDVATLIEDLAAEHRSLSAVLDSLDDRQWKLPTDSPGWAISHQVSHLEFFDRRATLALADPDAFIADRRRVIASAPRDPSVDLANSATRERLVESWRQSASELLNRATKVAPEVRVPWYGPSMSLGSFLTARLMECWAHGEDIASAAGVERTPTDRLRHIAHIGVATRAFSLVINSLPADDTTVEVRLRSPAGEMWSWSSGSGSASGQSVTGDVLDFCRVVTQRRRSEETSLIVNGESAQSWMRVAQAFAGPPGRG